MADLRCVADLRGIYFPHAITLGGWLGGALLWHFAAMWLLAVNFLLYLTINVVSGRFQASSCPSARAASPRSRAAMRGGLSHDDLSRYNRVQRFAYIAVIADTMLLIVSGLAIWKPVQFPLLRGLLGGYDAARVVHFFAMVFLVGFVARACRDGTAGAAFAARDRPGAMKHG